MLTIIILIIVILILIIIIITRDSQAQDAISFAAANSSACSPDTLSTEAKKLLNNPDSVVSRLLRARSRPGTQDDNESEDVSTQI